MMSHSNLIFPLSSLFYRMWRHFLLDDPNTKNVPGVPECSPPPLAYPYLRKFGNPSISKYLVVAWLSMHSSLRTSVRKKKKRVAPSPYFRYIFDIRHPCYDKLTAVSARYLLTSITWHLIEVLCLLSWPLIRYWVSIRWWAQVRLVLRGRMKKYMKKGISAQIKPWHVLFFLPTYSLNNRLGNFLIYCVRNFYNLGYFRW